MNYGRASPIPIRTYHRRPHRADRSVEPRGMIVIEAVVATIVVDENGCEHRTRRYTGSVRTGAGAPPVTSRAGYAFLAPEAI